MAVPQPDLDGRSANLGEDSLAEAVQAGTSEFLTRVGQAFAAEEGWRSQLRAVAYEMLRFLQDDLERARLMVIESPTASERVRVIREDGIAALVELIDRGRYELPNPDLIPRSTAEVTAGAIYNRMHVALEDDNLARGIEMVPELMFTVRSSPILVSRSH